MKNWLHFSQVSLFVSLLLATSSSLFGQTASQRDESSPGSARQTEARDFYAGFYLGYLSGYADAADDELIYVIDLQRQRAAQRRRDQQVSQQRRGDQQTEQIRSALRQRMRGGDMRGRAGMRTEQVRGEIQRQKTIEQQRTGQEHQIVLLKTDQGRTRIVDLGPKDRLQGIELQQGKRIAVRGPSVDVGDFRVLLASQLRADGQTLNLQRRRGGQDSIMTRRQSR